MIKYICIKECESFFYDHYIFKIGEIVEQVSKIENESSDLCEIVLYNSRLRLLSNNVFIECFIALGELREKQIKDILDD